MYQWCVHWDMKAHKLKELSLINRTWKWTEERCYILEFVNNSAYLWQKQNYVTVFISFPSVPWMFKLSFWFAKKEWTPYNGGNLISP